MEAKKIKKKKITRNHQAWSPRYIDNYISLILPLAFIARLMGFLPYKILASQFVVSKLFLVFSTILVVIYICLLPFSAYVINITYREDISVRLHGDFIIILGPVIMISSYIAQRRLVQAMEGISKVSQMLPPEFFTKSAKIILVKDAIMIVLPFVHLPYVITKENVTYVWICWGTFFVITITNCLYTNSLYVLNGCFRQINDSLVNVRDTLINDEPHLLRRVYHTQKNPVLLAKLRALKEQHLRVSETLRAFNEALSTQNAAIITLLFVDITFNMYTYTVVQNDGGQIKTWGTFSLLFLIYHSVHVVMMVWPAEVARMQIEQMGTNIHRIIVRTFDDQVTSELQMFSLQILQTDNTSTAKGFVMDATLLTKILGGITTLLLILIQFLLVKPC